MKVILAPMEGVIDYNMRQMLTELGGYDRCVTEFIRVTNNPVPLKVLRRLCPELDADGKTRSGVPVYIQLLGGDPKMIADSAVIATKAGALGIDLNFGCPTKIVNRHDGGSVLLKEPHRVGDIVSTVRQAVDPSIPVCAKIRLGFDNADFLAEIVAEVYRAGANELCVHARTRTQGYKPPAYWSELAELDRSANTRLIVNGEIWSVKDADKAMQESHCSDIMVGRGGLAKPDLARLIRVGKYGKYSGKKETELTWQEVAAMVDYFYHHQDSNSPKYAGNRTKQWLVYLTKNYPEAVQLFEAIKRLSSVDSIAQTIHRHRNNLDRLEIRS